jgi:hypothetical protein
MRENRPYGLEGGESGSTGLPYPYREELLREEAATVIRDGVLQVATIARWWMIGDGFGWWVSSAWPRWLREELLREEAD